MLFYVRPKSRLNHVYITLAPSAFIQQSETKAHVLQPRQRGSMVNRDLTVTALNRDSATPHPSSPMRWDPKLHHMCTLVELMAWILSCSVRLLHDCTRFVSMYM